MAPKAEKLREDQVTLGTFSTFCGIFGNKNHCLKLNCSKLDIFDYL